MIDTAKFQRPGLGARLRQASYLLKNTFTVVGRDADIVAPLTRMVVYGVAMVTTAFAGLLACLLRSYAWGALLLGLAALLFVYKFFYYNRRELAQSWLAFETACGHDRSPKEARARVGELGGQVRRLALLDMGAAWIGMASRRESGGILGALIGLVLKGLTEVWDLANHFLLPAVASDGVTLREGLSRLERVKDSVPETLVGVFGIDVMGRVVATIMAPAYLLLLAVGAGAGLWLGGLMPAATQLGPVGSFFDGGVPAWLPLGPDAMISWLPLLVCLFIGQLGGTILSRVVTSVKVLYFTLFYARLVHAEELAPDLRVQLEGYLRMEPVAA
jgi:hypothetical protein